MLHLPQRRPRVVAEPVRLVRPDGSPAAAPIDPFPGFTGSVRTAAADVTGDGVADVIAAAGPGGAPGVAVLDGSTGATIVAFGAFEAAFRGGLYVAAADLDGDGKAEVVVTPDRGGGPVVAVYSGAALAGGAGIGALVCTLKNQSQLVPEGGRIPSESRSLPISLYASATLPSASAPSASSIPKIARAVSVPAIFQLSARLFRNACSAGLYSPSL